VLAVGHWECRASVTCLAASPLARQRHQLKTTKNCKIKSKYFGLRMRDERIGEKWREE